MSVESHPVLQVCVCVHCLVCVVCAVFGMCFYRLIKLNDECNVCLCFVTAGEITAEDTDFSQKHTALSTSASNFIIYGLPNLMLT